MNFNSSQGKKICFSIYFELSPENLYFVAHGSIQEVMTDVPLCKHGGKTLRDTQLP